MSIKYTYKILSVDQAARSMEVVYNSEGNPTMHVCARLPYAGEELDSVIEMYAPLRYWEEIRTPTVPVSAGQTGTLIATTTSTLEVAIRARNEMLAQTDWTQLPDAPLTDELKAAWGEYRQALRDITTQPGFPDKIKWPSKPGLPVTVL